MIVDLTGLLGTIFLILTYVVVLHKKTEKLFIPVNILASSLLTVHAILIKDLAFSVTNGFIVAVLVFKWIKHEPIL